MPDRQSRREFARWLMVGGVSAAAQIARAEEKEAAVSDKAQEEEPKPQAVPEREPTVDDFRFAALLAEYPKEHLTEEMLMGIYAGVRQHRRRAERLRQVPLRNSDPPAFQFVVPMPPQPAVGQPAP